MAELSVGLGHFSAAASAAVSSGINAKDAMCLALTGATEKSENHDRAVKELRRAGPQTGPLAPTLSRLLKLKNRSQYQSADVVEREALNAVGWARKLHAGAKEVLAPK